MDRFVVRIKRKKEDCVDDDQQPIEKKSSKTESPRASDKDSLNQDGNNNNDFSKQRKYTTKLQKFCSFLCDVFIFHQSFKMHVALYVNKHTLSVILLRHENYTFCWLEFSSSDFYANKHT